MENAEIVRSEGHLSQRAMLSRELLRVEAEQRALLGAYVKQEMVVGTDYGVIPGTAKPTLLKPGAEKLLALFHCSPEFELVRDQCAQDFETGFFKYTFRVAIRAPGGPLLAEGYGSANSREARYRWRTAKRTCPSCGSNVALLASKKQGDGFFCWAKKGGCGATFKEGDERITKQMLGRVENEDIADLDNTILKMAKKRALVDGAIALARCSDMFTQDVEDFAGGHEAPREDAPARQAAGDDGPPPPSDGDAPPPSEDSAPSARKDKPTKRLTAKEAEKIDRSKVLVAFGKWKSVPVSKVPDEELGDAAAFGEALIKENPTHFSVPAIENKLLLLGLETEARMKRPAGGAAP
jgi:hypothetical protein